MSETRLSPATLKAAGWTHDRTTVTQIGPRGSLKYHCWVRGMWRIATLHANNRYDKTVHACVCRWATTMTVSGFRTRATALDNLGRLDGPDGRTVAAWALAPVTEESTP